MIKKILLLALSLIALPFISFAQIPVVNPGNMFTNTDFATILKNIANFIIAFITILGIIFIVWGAIKYTTAGSDESQAEEAKTIITYAVIGLFIAAMAYAIEDLVLRALLI